MIAKQRPAADAVQARQYAAVQEDAALLDVTHVAALLGCSPRHVYRLSDAGRMPRPLKLGALVRWNRQSVLDWIASGCRPVTMPRPERPVR